MMIQEREWMIHLLDYYGDLLTETQQTVMKLYYEDDLGFSEIAENRNVSRNAVHDMIKTCEQLLVDYEKKLALYQKWQRRKALIEEFKQTRNDALLEDIEE
jgi:predicted DNA-binding protein YlxM (UPF0122 family)